MPGFGQNQCWPCSYIIFLLMKMQYKNASGLRDQNHCKCQLQYSLIRAIRWMHRHIGQVTGDTELVVTLCFAPAPQIQFRQMEVHLHHMAHHKQVEEPGRHSH